MKTPRFTVVIPTLNEEKFLPRLLKDLTKQTVDIFDVVVVDGNSKDKTLKVAEAFKRKIRNYTVTSCQAGVSRQRNVGARMGRGEYLVFVDADSRLLPYALERMAVYIDEYHSQIFTTWFRADTDLHSDAVMALFGNLVIVGSLIMKRPLAPGPLTVVSRDAFELVNGYDEERSFGEDQDLSIRLKDKGMELEILQEVLFVLSLRRFRAKGKIRTLNSLTTAFLMMLLTKKNYKVIESYVTGGHIYDPKYNKKKKTVINDIEKKLKELMRELFE